MKSFWQQSVVDSNFFLEFLSLSLSKKKNLVFFGCSGIGISGTSLGYLAPLFLKVGPLSISFVVNELALLGCGIGLKSGDAGSASDPNYILLFLLKGLLEV